ncbi:MAG: ribulose-phosphate 3-epimerase [Actinomycetia bacterium]|nr:ribulose-phosphate 3-epimerase [Actinomycetes bacterium]
MPNPSGVQIVPSLLSADFMNLQRDVRLIEHGELEWLHVDVMDGHFVPNMTVGPPVVRALKRISSLSLDVHLMIDNPAEQLDWYLEAGADLVCVHLESAGSSERTDARAARPARAARAAGFSVSVTELYDPEPLAGLLGRIRAAGRLAGLALNPGTPAELALPFFNQLDLLLVMSVHPGFGGQTFIETALEKLRFVSRTAAAQGLEMMVEVDGGINAATAPQVVAAGANMLVAGNAIFGAANPLAALAGLRAAIDGQ